MFFSTSPKKLDFDHVVPPPLRGREKKGDRFVKVIPRHYAKNPFV
jgi:hypothetical protein